jgi:cobalt-zinc-cadmium resistance protein CzcA
MAEAARLKVRTGESAGLDSISAVARSREISVQLSILNRDILVQQEILRRLTNANFLFLPELSPLSKVPVEFSLDTLRDHPALRLQTQSINIAEAELNVQKQANKPSFDGRFFSQRLYGLSNPYSGFSVSVGIPLFGRSAYRNRVRAAELERDYQRAVIGYQTANLNSQYNQSMQQLRKDEELLRFYETTGLAQAEAIIKAANISYRAGEISFADLSQFLTQAIDIQRNYLEILSQYNQSAIQLNFFLNR